MNWKLAIVGIKGKSADTLLFWLELEMPVSFSGLQILHRYGCLKCVGLEL